MTANPERPAGRPARRLWAVVHGRVQGVNFRQFTRGRAQALGLTGWVRNRSDGTVELVAEGRPDDLQRLLAQVHRGPSTAHVAAVDLEWQEATGEFQSFQVRYF